MAHSNEAAEHLRKRGSFFRAASQSIWVPKIQTPDEWGAANRVYGPGTGWPGQRNPYLTPYSIPFSRAFSSAKYRRVVLVTAAQSSKTETFLDIIGERLDNRPAPILYVGPTKDFIRDQFEPRIRELFEQSKSLAAKMVGGINGKQQKQSLKRVNGTRLRLAHSGSSTALKSDPASMALVDEYDEMLANIKGQGDPLGLVEARGDTYADFVTGIVSTPSVGMIETELDEATGLEFWKQTEPDAVSDIKSPIWRLWQEGTRHHWCWQCVHCKEWFVPRFKLLEIPENATPLQARRETFLRCPRNGCVLEERHKAEMNAGGRHVAPGQSVDQNGLVHGDPPESSTLSFWVSGLASPFRTFGERAEFYVRAKRSLKPDSVQTAINSQFGELFVDAGGDVPPWEEIYNARLGYRSGTVPPEVRYLTAGIDVGKRRLIYVVRGWGYRGTSWLIKHGELLGETAEAEIWSDLDDFLATPIDGHLIKLAFLDSGFRPGKKEGVPVNRVYEFCRRHRRFVFPTKGSSRPLLRPLIKAQIEVTSQGKAAPYGLELMRLDPDHWKSFVHEKLVWPVEQPGAWYLHNDVDENYCRQLIAEVRVTTEDNKHQWIVRSRENHYLDAEAMAAAAGFQLNVQHLRGRGSRTPPPAPAPAAQPVEPADVPPPAPRRNDLYEQLTKPAGAAAPAAAPVPAMASVKKGRFFNLAARLNR
ncbi:terminase gpA endonuclease subunit [Bradyrhizobium sp. SZCCHNR2012]|uniref:terminase gpA endonuclease subunit n=1 Tax=Bradyrhizobium sp. SZCCHNR2012 TaxID=3057377 RepID=UPI0028EEECFF|nr:terminase gpA endonuclease subunit [Bradyrhizobium sp. SZCCHNR2012]